jgi:hypothetical protein
MLKDCSFLVFIEIKGFVFFCSFKTIERKRNRIFVFELKWSFFHDKID